PRSPDSFPFEVRVTAAGTPAGGRRPPQGGLFHSTPLPYPMKPRLGLLKRLRFGNTVGRSVALTPNQGASVAEYSAAGVGGTQRPSPVSSGPLMARVGTRP